MKIKGYKNIHRTFEAVYKEPFPVLKAKVLINGIEIDIPVVRSEVNYVIDGEMYTGYNCFLLTKADKVKE